MPSRQVALLEKLKSVIHCTGKQQALHTDCVDMCGEIGGRTNVRLRVRASRRDSVPTTRVSETLSSTLTFTELAMTVKRTGVGVSKLKEMNNEAFDRQKGVMCREAAPLPDSRTAIRCDRRTSGNAITSP